jgi:hypothetical protein
MKGKSKKCSGCNPKQKPPQGGFCYIINVMKGKNSKFHILISAAALILFWRGFWGLADLYLFPQNPALSFILSIGLGLLIIFLFHDENRLL